MLVQRLGSRILSSEVPAILLEFVRKHCGIGARRPPFLHVSLSVKLHNSMFDVCNVRRPNLLSSWDCNTRRNIILGQSSGFLRCLLGGSIKIQIMHYFLIRKVKTLFKVCKNSGVLLLELNVDSNKRKIQQKWILNVWSKWKRFYGILTKCKIYAFSCIYHQRVNSSMCQKLVASYK